MEIQRQQLSPKAWESAINAARDGEINHSERYNIAQKLAAEGLTAPEVAFFEGLKDQKNVQQLAETEGLSSVSFVEPEVNAVGFKHAEQAPLFHFQLNPKVPPQIDTKLWQLAQMAAIDGKLSASERQDIYAQAMLDGEKELEALNLALGSASAISYDGLSRLYEQSGIQHNEFQLINALHQMPHNQASLIQALEHNHPVESSWSQLGVRFGTPDLTLGLLRGHVRREFTFSSLEQRFDQGFNTQNLAPRLWSASLDKAADGQINHDELAELIHLARDARTQSVSQTHFDFLTALLKPENVKILQSFDAGYLPYWFQVGHEAMPEHLPFKNISREQINNAPETYTPIHPLRRHVIPMATLGAVRG